MEDKKDSWSKEEKRRKKKKKIENIWRAITMN
jgi:hypothetical protein